MPHRYDSVPPPPHVSAGKNPDFASWKVDELKSHLRELGLQVSGKKELLIERLYAHYAGVQQHAFGCSTTRATAHKAGNTYVASPGTQVKCSVCGEYGHAAGDMRCKMYAETEQFAEARAAELERRARATRPMPSAPKAPPKPKKGDVNQQQPEDDAPSCPKCRARGMFRRGEFWICRNSQSFARCTGKIADSDRQVPRTSGAARMFRSDI